MAKGWHGLVTRDDGTRHFACDKPNCYYRLIVKKPDDMEHQCPFIGTTTIGWSVTKTLVQQVWDLLDADIARIKELQGLGVTADDQGTLDDAKGGARRLADVLAIFMSPHFTERNKVLAEGQRRWKAKQANDTTYETPGLGSLRHMPPPGSEEYFPSRVNKGFTTNPEYADTSTLPAKAVTHNFDEDTVKKIKLFASPEGGFTPEDLASVHGVSVAVIRAVLSS